jgi:ketosteroid isomerase-like protein
MADTRELYRRWIEELWSGDLGVADQLLTEDFTGHWPDREVEGRQALVDLIRETRAMFEALTFRIELGPVVDGDLVAARWTGTGRTPDGASMALLGHDLLRVRDGRFAEYWVASDAR